SAKFFITKRILSQYVNLNEIEHIDKNFKSQLIEWSQKNKRDVRFDTFEEPVESNKKPSFIASVFVDGEEIGKGFGSTKKEAQQNAARETLRLLEQNDEEL
ncbi:MAG: ribonuclease III, partial [Prolixibacteraceae bacterium]|nr:ribonuclease III [Prolixibacteraceae bacterium]